jgi:hypothetical protein
MTFRLWVRGHTRAQIDAELELFAEHIRAPMNASRQPVEIIAPTIAVLRPGGGQQALLALLELVRQRFDPKPTRRRSSATPKAADRRARPCAASSERRRRDCTPPNGSGAV